MNRCSINAQKHSTLTIKQHVREPAAGLRAHSIHTAIGLVCDYQSGRSKHPLLPSMLIQIANMTYHQQEVKLSSTSTERDLYDSLAEIYSIIITIDALEKAYLKDSITESDYTDTCSRLLKQYKSNLADETVARAFGDLETFKREWDVCRVAVSNRH
jgi:hypothetical protein